MNATSATAVRQTGVQPPTETGSRPPSAARSASAEGADAGSGRTSVPAPVAPPSGGTMGPGAMLTTPPEVGVGGAVKQAALASSAPAPVAECRFRALGYDIALEITHDEASDTYRATGDVDGPVEFDEVEKQTMTHEQIMADDLSRWALRQVGIDPASTESLDWYAIRLDDDGGGLHVIQARQQSGELREAGMFSFMGGVRGGACKRE